MSRRRTGVVLAAFAGGLAVAFAAAFGAGTLAGTVAGTGTGAVDTHSTGPEGHADMTSHGSTAVLAGLSVSDAGYTLAPAATTLPAGGGVPFAFEVLGPDGAAVTGFTPSHEKDLHLIVVRRDLTGFQHVHPVRDAAGTWTVPLDLAEAGTYRVFADFVPAVLGSTLTLGADIAVAGTFTPVPLPEPAAQASVEEYDVRLDGVPTAGRESELAFTVTRGGRPVEDLEAYLGAFGHLVSLRAGDLAYLHNHPAQDADPGTTGGPEIRFATTFPTEGTYRLFLDFQHGGRVRTAEFTVRAGDAAVESADVGHDSTPHDH